MTKRVKNIIEESKRLSPNERAFIAHCLISSLELIQDDGVDSEWAKLAEKRYDELVSGKVGGVSWEKIKQNIID